MSNKDPLNQIQYYKSMWEGAGDNKGLQTWAQQQAQQYYDKLDPNVSKQVQGMNAQQLGEYRNSSNTQVSQPTVQAPTVQNYSAPTFTPTVQAPQMMNIQDFAKQMGFDYSRENAKTRADAEAQAKRDAANQGKRAVDSRVEGSVDALDRNYFLKGLQQAQGQANSGLNGGIAADQDLRMAMSRQANMGDIYRDANLEHMRLEDNLGRVELERLARENDIYDTRLQQGFQNTMGYNDVLRRNFESDRNFERGSFESDRNFGRGVFESDRGFDESVFQDRRNFDRGVFESDRGFDWNKTLAEAGLTGMYNGQQTVQDQQRGLDNLFRDKTFDRGVFESDRGFNELSEYQKQALAKSGGGSGSSNNANFAKMFEDIMKQYGQPSFNQDLNSIPMQNFYTVNPHFRDFLDGKEQSKRNHNNLDYRPFF